MARIDIPFILQGQNLVQSPRVTIAAGGQNYFYAVFKMDNAWEGIDHTKAVFERGDIVKVVDLVRNDKGLMECEIPWEVMAEKGYFDTGMFGGDRLPSDLARTFVTRGCVCEGDAPLAPTPDWFTKMEQALQSCDDVFIAEYGETSYEDVKKAWDEGKLIVCHKAEYSGGNYAILSEAYTGTSGNYKYFRFVTMNNSYYSVYTIYSDNDWFVSTSYWHDRFANKNHTHTPESIGAIPSLGESISNPETNIDDLRLTKCYFCGATVIKNGLKGDLPFTSSHFLKVEDFTGTGTRAIQTAYKNNSIKPERKWRLWNGTVWSPWQNG